MEHIIAKLLQDFEQGKLSRRQLIQGLALAATAGYAVVAPSAAEAIEPSLHEVSVNHITWDVKDHNKCRDFYSGLFGMRVFEGTNKLENHLKVGDTYLTFRGPGARKGPQPQTPRVDHICIAVKEWANNKSFGPDGEPA